MRRRHLLALSPALALAACGTGGTDPQGTTGPALPDDPEATGPGSNAPTSTGGDGTNGGEASPSEEAPSLWDPSEAVTALLDGLSPRQMAGQLVLVGIAAGGSIPQEVLTEHHAGGIFLLDVWRDPDQVDGIVTAAHEGSDPQLPPLIAVDQEGGQVRMLRGDAARRTPSAKELGSTGPEAVREAYTSIGEDLAARGITVALSPVADVVDPQLGSGNDPVGGLDRGFGTDPEQVGACVAGAVDALDATGTAATLKHFPGLGRVEQNTDHSAEGILDEVTTAADPFLDSFAAGIDAGAELVMLSSATYARIDGQAPAMFSRAVVTDLLRDQLGFEGLAVTDDIGAAKAVASVPVAERATRGEEQAARVRASAGRMLTLKERRGLLGPAPD